VLDSKGTLTSHTFRLVAASQQIRVCEASVTNTKSVNDHYVTTTQGLLLST